MPEQEKVARYNVVSTRLSDDEREELNECMHFTNQGQTEYLRQAILEKNEREKSACAMPKSKEVANG